MFAHQYVDHIIDVS